VTISKLAILNAVKAAISRAKASGSPYAQGKAYELRVLLRLLRIIDSAGYKLTCTPKMAGVLTFGGSPCKANHPDHDYISGSTSTEKLEIRISVQVTTLSHSWKGTTVVKAADRHEIDVGVYRPIKTRRYPAFTELLLGVSCKTGGWNKAYVREALGMRRELGFLTSPRTSLTSSAPWFIATVPCDPRFPLPCTRPTLGPPCMRRWQLWGSTSSTTRGSGNRLWSTDQLRCVENDARFGSKADAITGPVAAQCPLPARSGHPPCPR